MVDYFNFEGLLRWTLILAFMVSKAALIVAVFMHLFWERYVIVNVLLWPMTLMLLFVGIMAAESEYTLFTRLFYFVAGS
jgi:cytochrome c oxidase subunit IV